MSDASERMAQAFDRGFAQPLAVAGEAPVRMAAIRVGESRFVLPLDQLDAIEFGRAIGRLPGAVAPLIGVAGLRSRILAVFGLHALLGVGGSEQPRWLAVVGGDRPIGLAFDELLGQRSAHTADYKPVQAGDGRGGLVSSAVSLDGALHGVLDVSALLLRLRGRTIGS